jgi:hypothetical protein
MDLRNSNPVPAAEQAPQAAAAAAAALRARGPLPADVKRSTSEAAGLSAPAASVSHRANRAWKGLLQW